jgi:hypothetical protein
MDTVRPLVFVAMPFGQKRDPRLGYVVDFDAIYQNGIKPAIDGLDVDVIRADEEHSGGVIHVAMFERLLLAEIAIVDVTIDNANVFYELGVRHTARASSTIIVASSDRVLPFDIAMIRALPYKLDNGILTGENAAAFSQSLKDRLQETLLRMGSADSPLFQMIDRFPGVALDIRTAESFRERAQRFNEVRKKLALARLRKDREVMSQIERSELANLNEANFELVVDMLLSYRDIKAFDELLALVERIPAELYNRSVRVQQVQGFALNRRNGDDDRTRAIAILQEIVSKAGDDPETCGLLGSIAKIRRDEALRADDGFSAKTFLGQAIKWYRRGFLADSRDYYPGINLCNLLAIEGSAASLAELKEMLPVVKLAARRAGGEESADFWVVATAMNIAVLENDWDAAARIHGRIFELAKGGIQEQPQPWMLESTARDLASLGKAHIASVDADSLQSLIQAVERTRAELEAAAAVKA